ncbi:MAG: ABC transporter ATP-binding protein [Anaerolineae bacterium]|nr:ABC transporter ATP-binding protein [Anaerolineae bacterium]
MTTPILELRHVTKVFAGGSSKREATVALDDMSLSLKADSSKIITVAGESGSGKTTMGMLLLGFYGPTLGSVLYDGMDISAMKREQMFQYRRNIQAIFQDPFAVYNPFYKVDNLLSIPIKNFKLASSQSESRTMMEEALTSVGLRPEETLGRYPHQLSGGQRQRIAVARALLLKPKLLIADEPVSMVDASLRSTILKSLRALNQDYGIPILYITHDLTTAYHVSDYIMILYRGSVMEAGNVDKIIRDPQHPYTQLLIKSIPWPDPNLKWGDVDDMLVQSRTAFKESKGCKFANRCPKAHDICYTGHPELFGSESDRVVSCYLFKDSPVVSREDLSRLFRD